MMYEFIPFCPSQSICQLYPLQITIERRAKIRNQYKQVPQLTRGTIIGKFIFSTRIAELSYLHGLRRRDTKESTCLLRHITTEKLGLCQNAVCIT